MIDEYTTHKTKLVLKAIRELGCRVSILPAGSTNKIQVLDVGIIKPFKGHVRDKSVNFMVNENNDNFKDISRQMLAAWNVESYDKIEADSSYMQACADFVQIHYF